MGDPMSNSTVCFPPPTKYLNVMLVFTLLFCPQISQAIESRKIEKLIEGAQSPIEKQISIKEEGSSNIFRKSWHSNKNNFHWKYFKTTCSQKI